MKPRLSAMAILRRIGAVALALAWLGAAPALAGDGRPRLVLLGDSLVAGYGLPTKEAFPAKLQAALTARGVDVDVVDSGISGHTSAGGRARLDLVLAEPPRAVILELGANDGLRGLKPSTTEDNLDAIIGELRRRRIKVLLAGMYAPPNLGRDYGQAFNAVYPRLAKVHSIPLYPFFLDGVAGVPELNQADGMHPNAKGVDVIVERILPYVLKLLGRS
jgi:acyl-CoA thioesterase-1